MTNPNCPEEEVVDDVEMLKIIHHYQYSLKKFFFYPTLYVYEIWILRRFNINTITLYDIQGEAHKVLQTDSTQTIDHIQKCFR